MTRPTRFDSLPRLCIFDARNGYLFISLGENRYMGGRNESSLNVDDALPGATLVVDDRVVVREGKLNVDAD